MAIGTEPNGGYVLKAELEAAGVDLEECNNHMFLVLYTSTAVVGLQVHAMGEENKDWGERHLAFSNDLITYLPELPHLCTTRGYTSDPGLLRGYTEAPTTMLHAGRLATISAYQFWSLYVCTSRNTGLG